MLKQIAGEFALILGEANLNEMDYPSQHASPSLESGLEQSVGREQSATHANGDESPSADGRCVRHLKGSSVED